MTPGTKAGLVEADQSLADYGLPTATEMLETLQLIPALIQQARFQEAQAKAQEICNRFLLAGL